MSVQAQRKTALQAVTEGMWKSIATARSGGAYSYRFVEFLSEATAAPARVRTFAAGALLSIEHSSFGARVRHRDSEIINLQSFAR